MSLRERGINFGKSLARHTLLTAALAAPIGLALEACGPASTQISTQPAKSGNSSEVVQSKDPTVVAKDYFQTVINGNFDQILQKTSPKSVKDITSSEAHKTEYLQRETSEIAGCKNVPIINSYTLSGDQYGEPGIYYVHLKLASSCMLLFGDKNAPTSRASVIVSKEPGGRLLSHNAYPYPEMPFIIPSDALRGTPETQSANNDEIAIAELDLRAIIDGNQQALAAGRHMPVTDARIQQLSTSTQALNQCKDVSFQSARIIPDQGSSKTVEIIFNKTCKIILDRQGTTQTIKGVYERIDTVNGFRVATSSPYFLKP